jgi:hypothetical protein
MYRLALAKVITLCVVLLNRVTFCRPAQSFASKQSLSVICHISTPGLSVLAYRWFFISFQESRSASAYTLVQETTHLYLCERCDPTRCMCMQCSAVQCQSSAAPRPISAAAAAAAAATAATAATQHARSQCPRDGPRSPCRSTYQLSQLGSK